MPHQLLMHARTTGSGVVSRRSFLKAATAGAAAATIGWKEAVVQGAPEMRKQGMACILLFMNGAPSQFETFDPKPGQETGGPTKAIPTSVPGLEIAEDWPKTAKIMHQCGLIRTLTNKEGAHPRAVYQLHTGYIPNASTKYPTFGSIAAKELGQSDFDLPHFVSVSGRRGAVGAGSGFLGMQFAPFVVNDPNRMPSNTELAAGIDAARFNRRIDLMKDLENDFANSGGGHPVREHQALVGSASQLVLSPKLKAFDLSQEKEAMREKYGKSPFGQACLLARRLVETGVTFIEIESDGWDTHQNNFERVKQLAGPTDQGMAALISDLQDRGMLERTLVIWMGEFGRSPRINGQNGRDHFPRAFPAVLAGAGIKGGTVVGKTNADGSDIKERPVQVTELFQTFCQALKINPKKENLGPLERPIKIVDGGAPVGELFG